MQIIWETWGECSGHSVVSGCSVLGPKEYKRRHHKVFLNIHCALCKKYRGKLYDRWYEHKAESVIENHIVKIL